MQQPTRFTNDPIIISAYYKSFLKTLDESNNSVSDWEGRFIESCLLRRDTFTEKQIAVIVKLMDRFPKCYPKMEHYQTAEASRKFLMNG